MNRECTKQSFAIGTTIGASDPVNIEADAGGMIHLPASATITSMTFWAAPKDSTDFDPAYDDQVPPVALAVTGISVGANGAAIPIPAAMFGAAQMKIVGDQAVTAVINRKS